VGWDYQENNKNTTRQHVISAFQIIFVHKKLEKQSAKGTYTPVWGVRKPEDREMTFLFLNFHESKFAG
jgi:hypothetical protein